MESIYYFYLTAILNFNIECLKTFPRYERGINLISGYRKLLSGVKGWGVFLEILWWIAMVILILDFPGWPFKFEVFTSFDRRLKMRIYKRTLFLLSVFVLVATQVFAVTEIQWWHAMGGRLGEKVNEITDGFNSKQSKYSRFIF